MSSAQGKSVDVGVSYFENCYFVSVMTLLLLFCVSYDTFTVILCQIWHFYCSH